MMRIVQQAKPATIEEQKKRNQIEQPIIEIDESESDTEKKSKQTKAF